MLQNFQDQQDEEETNKVIGNKDEIGNEFLNKKDLLQCIDYRYDLQKQNIKQDSENDQNAQDQIKEQQEIEELEAEIDKLKNKAKQFKPIKQPPMVFKK